MPAYNEERYLAQAIESVLAQTYRDFELIVLDDGSRDRTREIAQSYACRDPRVRVENHENVGIGPTLNRGFSLAANEWVAMLQADDVMAPNRLERQLAFLAEHPEVDAAGSWCKHIDGQGKVIAKGNSPLTTHEAVQKLYAANEPVIMNSSTAMIRKSAVLAIGGYRAQFRVNEDVDMWNRLLESGYKLLVQPEYLAMYRIHAGSVSIGRARFIRSQVRWVKECMLRRRSGRPELTWEEYAAYHRMLPWYVRVNMARKDTAKVLYKAATFQYSQHKYHLVALTVLAAMIFQPSYIFRQISSKLLVRKS
jgi:glycosyltransferase involved in cell wall biosynthesis